MPKPRPALHRFRFAPGRPAKSVHLKGDFVDWLQKHELKPAADGAFELPLELEPGVYAYKFHVDEGSYVLDPANPRTEAGGGFQNSLLVVGGTDEPVVHAPARPCLFVDDSGSVVVRARLRRGAGEGLDLLVRRSDGFSRTAMALAGGDAEHLWLEARLDHAAKGLAELPLRGHRSGLRLGGERSASAAPSWRPSSSPPPPSRASTRPAAAGRSVYPIRPRPLPLRLRPAGAGPQPRRGGGAQRGGDLRGVLLAIPHLADLGADALPLTRSRGRPPTTATTCTTR
jgi:hypothetical protein